MSLLSARSSRRCRRALCAIGTVALAFVPSVAALQHAAHAEALDVEIHSEAVHPNAAPHLDRKEHQASDRCPVCLHDARALGEEPGQSTHRVDRGSFVVSDVVVGVGSRTVRTAQPRAPPA